MLIAASVTIALGGCVSTNTKNETTAVSASNTIVESVTPQTNLASAPAASKNGEITLKQIMSDPQWIGALPTNMGWSVDGSAIVFERERENSALSDVYVIDSNNVGKKAKRR